MESSLNQALKEKQEYLACLSGTMDEDAIKLAADKRKDELLGMIRGMTSIPVTQATTFLRDLNAGPFPTEVKKVLMTALNGKTSAASEGASPPTGASKRAALQKHMYIHNYLSNADWDLLQKSTH